MEIEMKNPGRAGAGAGVHEKTIRCIKDSSSGALSQSADAPVVRVILRRVPWPRDGGNSGRKLRWDASTEGGELLVAASDEPLNQAAHALLARGLPPETLFTTRHECSSFDARVPMPVSGPAAAWQRRKDRAIDLAARMAREHAAVSRRNSDPTSPDTEVATDATKAEIGGGA